MAYALQTLYLSNTLMTKAKPQRSAEKLYSLQQQ